mmetsp:Transcript_308/g.888  ORF Transcript_308/g.888 Transcript_308/m.888 type:complete len:256 (+) Transcript_308:358-1125(+)
MHELVLDQAVRDWVLIPLTLSVVLMMVLRQYISKLMAGGPDTGKVDMKELREKQQVARSQVLRTNHGYITEAAFRERRHYFTAKETGLLCKKSESRSAQELMLSNPDMMMNMMKGQVTGFLPQIAMGMFVNYFFAGFILGKVPFQLSPSFRPMLQRGIELPSLDVTYFTSLSFYILLLFGLRGVFMLVFREETIDDTQMYQKQMAGFGANPNMMDIQKSFDQERAALDVTPYQGRLNNVEVSAAAMLRRNLAKQP